MIDNSIIDNKFLKVFTVNANKLYQIKLIKSIQELDFINFV